MKYILAALCFFCAALAAAQQVRHEALPPDTPDKFKCITDNGDGTYSWGVCVSEPMTTPKVEHKKHTETQTYDEVTRSCPAGYEGHFVDTRTGFGWEYWNGGWGFIVGPEPGYTVCFKKEFMDEIRKNPELLVARPAQPKGA